MGYIFARSYHVDYLHRRGDGAGTTPRGAPEQGTDGKHDAQRVWITGETR